MAGITSTDFTEVEVTKIGIKTKNDSVTKADIISCVGSLEEEMNCKTMQKKCGTRVMKTSTKGTGDGTVKVTMYAPQDLFADLHGMKRENLKDGIIAYGTGSLHEVVCITAEVENEDGEKKLKAYPNCTIQKAMSRKVDNGSEDIVMHELEFAVAPDEHGEGLYEAVAGDLMDETVKTTWMESFSRDLVEVEIA